CWKSSAWHLVARERAVKPTVGAADYSAARPGHPRVISVRRGFSVNYFPQLPQNPTNVSPQDICSALDTPVSPRRRWADGRNWSSSRTQSALRRGDRLLGWRIHTALAIGRSFRRGFARRTSELVDTVLVARLAFDQAAASPRGTHYPTFLL